MIEGLESKPQIKINLEKKTVEAKLPAKIEGDDYIFELHARYIKIRRSRSRTEIYTLDYESILDRARKNTLPAELVSVTKARKGRR